MDDKYPFQNPALPLLDRVRDLISRLTLEEKAGLIPTRNQPVERLGIAAFSFGAEGAHGFVDREGINTTFPQTIGLAAGWDRKLLRKIGEVAATEARIYYNTHGRSRGIAIWSPTVDLERDPRWGRTEEGYGEDPFLTGELSSAYIRGAQGDDPFYLRVSCGPKHFFANNNEKNRGSCSASIPPRCMREYYLVPFKAAIQKAKAASLMTAYNEVNGIPMMIHPMLNDIVKKEWGIEGNLVTDGGDFLQTVNLHNYFETHAETLAAALKNGGDSMTDMGDSVITAVKEALEKNLITEEEIDEHLERILSIRFRFGQFDPPGRCPYDTAGENDSLKKEYISLSWEAVRKSIVLLKNDPVPGGENNLLPLRPEKTRDSRGEASGTIAVLGPLADTVHLDWYTGIPAYVCTPLKGLREVYGKDRIVTAEYRDLVSFTTEDRRPIVLAEITYSDEVTEEGSVEHVDDHPVEKPEKPPGKKILCVGERGQEPARFYKEDWGWGSFTLADVESGLLLESPYWRREAGGTVDEKASVIAASGKSSHSWFGFSIFNLIPQEKGLFILRTFDNKRAVAAQNMGPVVLRDDLLPCQGELFRMTIEKKGLPASIEAAAKADKVIFIGGNNPMINGRECSDRPSMNLPPFQEEFIRRIAAVNPKLVLVMISGYPYTLGDLAYHIPSIIWMAPGIQETGNGLADVISGTYSPAGRLPMTWYEDGSQLPPIMEYDIISAGTTYQYFSGNVLWPFGHGLSYSSFKYSDLNIDKVSVRENETVNVSFKLKNRGSIQAEEVPQLYVNFTGSVFRRPIKTLKGFDRVFLAAGEEKTISFDLFVSELAVWDSFQEKFCVEAGYCTVLIGASSQDIRLSGGFKITGEKILPRKVIGPVYAERFDDYESCFLHEKRGSAIAAVFSSAAYCDKNNPGGGNFCCDIRDDGCCDAGWICFSGLDFGNGFSRFSAVVQGIPGSYIEIRLDAPDGALAGIIEVPNTGENYNYELNPRSPRRRPLWSFAETEMEKICGVHDLYLVLCGKTGIWRFEFN
uniref:Beta-glucosidase n=1 Tax=uncultured bacterium contig00026 TaxID=1181515 RepID=A0A806KAQ7_9BACT|nr:beta-glucosidase [uncultured bacterium contig00026]